MTKISLDYDVLEILYVSGYSPNQIAKLFGLSVTTINKHIRESINVEIRTAKENKEITRTKPTELEGKYIYNFLEEHDLWDKIEEFYMENPKKENRIVLRNKTVTLPKNYLSIVQVNDIIQSIFDNIEINILDKMSPSMEDVILKIKGKESNITQYKDFLHSNENRNILFNQLKIIKRYDNIPIEKFDSIFTYIYKLDNYCVSKYKYQNISIIPIKQEKSLSIEINIGNKY